MKIYVKDLLQLRQVYIHCRGRRGYDGMVVGFTTTYAISAYHHCRDHPSFAHHHQK